MQYSQSLFSKSFAEGAKIFEADERAQFVVPASATRAKVYEKEAERDVIFAGPAISTSDAPLEEMNAQELRQKASDMYVPQLSSPQLIALPL